MTSRSRQIAVHLGDRSIRNLESDMPKPQLLLIRCMNILRPKKMSKGHDNRFRPLIFDGRDRTTPDLRESSWMFAFQLIELGLLISNRNYTAFVQAGIAFVTGANADRETDQS